MKLVVVACLLGGVAMTRPAEACVTLAGDPEATAAIAAILTAREIELDLAPDCLGAQVDRLDTTLVIAIAGAERIVDDVETAATVIESFASDDGAPLLPVVPVPVRLVQPLPVVVVAPPRASRAVHVFAAAETSIGSDHTSWMGGHVGVCITLGPICAAARMRRARVVAGDGVWDGQLARQSKELLFGLDVPFSLGRATLSPGFAAGLGTMSTRVDDGSRTTIETGGLRADVHVTLTVPITRKWALDLTTALDLTQETRPREDMMTIPDEPVALQRFAIGVRRAVR